MKRYLWCLLCLGIVALCAFGFERRTELARAVPGQSPVSQPPDHVIFRTLFHHVQLMQQRAAESERNGDPVAARAYRRFLISRAQLTDAQTKAITDVASRCEMSVSQIDIRAKDIIELRRKQYATTGTIPPRSDLLDTLQGERNRTILGCRDQLRSALGEDEWIRFEDFLRRELVPKIQYGVPNE